MRKRKARKRASTSSKKGVLIIVGGSEDKKDEMKILSEVASRTGSGKLLIVTAASNFAKDAWEAYERAFKSLGVKKIAHLHIEQPDEARDLQRIALFDGVTTVFFTGGDQLKITTKIGGSPLYDSIMEVLDQGGTIAGTSAGAAVMGQIMLVGTQENPESHKVGNWSMSTGLGFVRNIVIDQHFAQRGRIGRLLAAVAMNPGVLGIGIDENTAIVVQEGKFRVLGENAVYVIDGHAVTHTNVSHASAKKTMSIHDVRLHVLGDGECFHLSSRKVIFDEEKGPSLSGESDRPSN